MKRDMDLVRYILMTVEKADGGVQIDDLTVDGKWSLSMVAYHVELMKARGLVDAQVYHAGDTVVGGIVTALTWDGTDYLDAVRDDAVWKRTKDVVRKSVGSTTLDVIKQAAVMVATSAIKSSLGL